MTPTEFHWSAVSVTLFAEKSGNQCRLPDGGAGDCRIGQEAGRATRHRDDKTAATRPESRQPGGKYGRTIADDVILIANNSYEAGRDGATRVCNLRGL
jgi:hypothetical protein